ncbi:helix-turn-helix domain-containing protein [Phenylobacterium sp.]|uniref:helix-turn-helix domain-containing protein n=1 Tax=Phenylobacterium sp. TaxID=1871053 RepID=UPI002E325373|nr:helix-turn-helix domain-containing protein [Phenylobacterium sp.]HEX3363484.1 helix-turn-helix domain-containing protein [Phenylobacterium sp.]
MASDSEALNLQSAADIGSALKALREQKQLSLEQLADMTRVRRVYLADIEAMRLDRLPSRPFTIGYIRAYAEALGLDGDAAVERFKSEEPVLDEPLRAPVGVVQNGDPRAVAIVAGVIVILVAIVLWNIAQRALMANAPPPPTASAQATAKALGVASPPVVPLGAPLPAPVESTTPPPYETPGMPIINPDGTVTTPKSVQGPKSGLTPETPTVDPSTLSQVFVATGQIYGAPKDQPSAVTLQALKPASLIVRGQDGQIYFARQFAAGDAFRAPQVGGLTAEVSQPASFQVFVGGRSKGFLPAAQVSLSNLAQ